ncbi:unnamed protein product, partial [Ixodes hexagonus]
GFFWHVSDFHYDKDYTTHGVRDAMCHYTPNQSGGDNIGPYGDFRCDAPRLLVESAIAAMRTIKPDPDFVLWTGDNLPHVKGIPWPDVYAATRWLGELLERAFPGRPLVPSLGNHDCSPANDMAPGNQSRFLSKADLNKLLPSSAWATFEKGGYYSWTLRESLRLVCLNSVLWYTGNRSPAANGSADDQLTWLGDQLREAYNLRQKVFIAGHVAPGFNNRAVSREVGPTPLFRDGINEKYQDLVGNFSKTVAGQFFGHQHGNAFVLLTDSAGRLRGSALLAGSVTPWGSSDPDYNKLSVPTNPTVRLYKYHRPSGRLLDYVVYYLDLDKANARPQESPRWEELYTLSRQYSLPDATTLSLASLARRLAREPALLDAYVRLGTAFKQDAPCDAFCRRVQLCAVLASRAEPHAACLGGPVRSAWQAPPASPPEATTLRDVLVGVSVSLVIVASIVLLVRAKRARMMAGPRYGRFA